MQRNDKEKTGREKRRWLTLLKPGDWLTILVIVLLAGFLLLVGVKNKKAAAGAVLLHRGELVHAWTMDELLEGGSYAFNSPPYSYTIVFEGGKIRFAEADCPDRVCVSSGWLTHSGQLAACVPGHVVLKMSEKEEQTVDVIIR